MTKNLNVITGRKVTQQSYTRALNFTRVYLNNPTKENEHLIYDSLQRFSRSTKSLNTVRRALRLRIFLFYHAQRKRNKMRFKQFVLLEQKLKIKRITKSIT